MYFLLDQLSLALSRLPQMYLDTLARVLARFAFSVLRIRRALVLANIAQAYREPLTPPRHKELAFLSVYHFVLNVLEFLAARREKLGEPLMIEGEEHLRAALAEGKGAYIMFVHTGWEVLICGLSRRIRPLHAIVKKVGSDAVNRFVVDQRERNGVFCVERKQKGDATQVLKQVLARGELLGFAIDQARPGGPLLPFFNRPAKTNTSLAALWRRYQAPVLPAYCARTKGGGHVIRVKPPLSLQKTQNVKSDILENSKSFNLAAETLIRECPEEYFWMHNRWKD